MSNLKPVKVSISGYQSIDKLEFEIKGLCVVAGSSNIGKSAIVRAMSSAILNNPVVGMVRNGSKYASVSMHTDAWGFKWEKSERGVNRYEIDGKVYDKVGQRQLEEVASMGFRSVKIGGDEINPWIAPQFFPMFLLDKSGPQVTDFISEVSRLNVLQNAVVLSARGKRRASDEETSKATEAAKFRAKQASVAGVKQLEGLCADLDAQSNSIDEYEARIELATSLMDGVRKAAGKVKSLEPAGSVRVPEPPDPASVSKLTEAVAINTDLESKAARVIAVRRITEVKIPASPSDDVQRLLGMSRFRNLPEDIEKADSLAAVSRVKVPDIDQTCVDKLVDMARNRENIDRAEDAVKVFGDVDIPDASMPELDALQTALALHRGLEEAASGVREVASMAKSIAKDLEDLEKEISEIPTCPTCNRPVVSTHTHAPGV